MANENQKVLSKQEPSIMANNRFTNACYIVLLILWVLSIPALPVIAIWKYIAGNVQFSTITLAIWVISFVAYYLFLKAHNKADKAIALQKEIECQNNKREYDREHLARRKAEGICKLDDRYVLVDSKNWDNQWNHPRANWVDWLEDEVQQLESDDKVYSYKFGHSMGLRIGYVIVRKGKVVANALTLMS